jgi:hypothetical protein
MTMPDVTAVSLPASVQGRWLINAHPPRVTPQDVTWFRGVPTTINGWSWSDPYGPKSLTLVFGAVTIFDRLGSGDLDWLRREANVDLFWVGSLPAGYPGGRFVWEGYIESLSWGAAGLTVECKGAMYQMDQYLAKPEYLARPLPYEVAILRQFREKDALRTGQPQIVFPAGWAKTYQPASGVPDYLRPAGIHTGDNWTALVTRSTGSWEPTLTSYIQSLLASMYTDSGRWTLDLLPGRIPTMLHRNFAYVPAVGQIRIDPADPGVTISLSQDFSQSTNAVYGSGKSLTGVSYSGQQVTPDGQETFYLPLAQTRQVEQNNKNQWFDPSEMRREILLQVQQGLEEDDALGVANAHLQHFTDPGFTGTITLRTDPEFVTAVTVNAKGGTDVTTTVVLPRMLVKPGMTMIVPKVFGTPEGLMLHISDVQASGADQSITLTVDSKYRDSLTVKEVQERGRDSLSVQRQLIGGQYTPPVSDQLVPWNYGAGSGYIPSGPHLSSLPLFRDMPPSTPFPWTDWTTLRPPSNPAYRNSYVHIGPKSSNADQNWAVNPDRHSGARGIPIRLSQAGNIRLIQIAAYDVNGNLMSVPFHVSFYYSIGVSYLDMPMLRSVDTPNGGYAAGQHYPFFNNAWEQYNLDGTKITSEQPANAPNSGLIRAFGTGIVPAGYWPGSKPAGDSPTGMLVDEGPWPFDFAAIEGNINYYAKRQVNVLAGYAYMMIYCDAQTTQDVYFAGRLFREEPGSQ